MPGSVQLTLPGVPDVYQGTESVQVALVDPDNRRPVDAQALADALGRLDAGDAPRTLAEEKLLVTSRALRVRRDHAAAFVGQEAGYRPLPASSGNALAFARTSGTEPVAITVATRLALSLERLGGWGTHTVALPDGVWRGGPPGPDGRGGRRELAELLDRLPVALLVRAHHG